MVNYKQTAPNLLDGIFARLFGRTSYLAPIRAEEPDSLSSHRPGFMIILYISEPDSLSSHPVLSHPISSRSTGTGTAPLRLKIRDRLAGRVDSAYYSIRRPNLI